MTKKTTADVPSSGKKGGRKTVSPLTRAQFLDSAKPVRVTLEHDGKTYNLVLAPREFSTGSFGFYTNDKLTVEIGGVATSLQCNLNLTVIGSKESV